MNLKQALAARIDELATTDGWRMARKTPTYVRPIAGGVDATFGLSFGGRGTPLTTLAYVSVYCEAAHRLGAELQGERFMRYEAATFGHAVNGLAPNGETGMWSVDEGNVAEVARAVYRDCVKFGQPIWDANKTIEAVAETVALPIHDVLLWQRPAVYYLAGRPQQALEAARRMVEMAGPDAAQVGFDGFLRRLEDRIESDRRSS